MSEQQPPTAEIDADTWASLDPAAHCFREDNCAHHETHVGPTCCCCDRPGGEHEGCDCD